MTKTLLILIFSILVISRASAQQGRAVMGTVADSTGALPGINVKLTSDKDSTVVATSAKGLFSFPSVISKNFKVTVYGIGYQTFVRRYVMDNSNKPILLDPIKLAIESKMLKTVNVVAVNPITIKEDTVEYKASAYKVREGSPVEDLLKKLPGVSVDKDGNVTAHGKQVTKVRVNGKDYFTGDVQTATQNLPADIVENIQVIDDYGDQANLTGIKTGDPDKILNITIQKGKRNGKFGQGTVGAGNDDKYVAKISANAFYEDTQLSLLGTVNNNNTNAFNFGSGSGGSGSGGGGRGGSQSSASNGISTANGITINKSLGFNYRDDWGKKITTYGSYSFADKDRTTETTSQQQNLFQSGAIINNDNTTDKNHSINHRFDFNMEYKIDTANYLKINPSFSYGSSNDINNDIFSNSRLNTVTNGTDNSITNANSPTGGANILYNHKFKKKGRNFSVSGSVNFSKSTSDLDDQYNTQTDSVIVPLHQQINTMNTSQKVNAHASYIEPIGKTTYLEANYTYSYTNTDNNRLNYRFDPVTHVPMYIDSLSTLYNYQFITNSFGLNLRGVKPKYNYTVGLVAKPTSLNGESHNFETSTHTFNLVPTAHFVYNFAKNHTLNFNYSGTNNMPSFTQLQVQPDYSNPQNIVYGNPNLKPEFSNNFTLRYNQFDIASGNSLFTNLTFNETQNKIVTNTQPVANTVLNPGDKKDSTVQETRYLNTNGFYSMGGNYSFSKPFANRKYTVSLMGGATYSNNVSYIEGDRNLSKNLVWNQGAKVRFDLDSIMDTEVSANYSANTTKYSIPSSVNGDARTWTLGLDGRNFFWYDLILGYNLTQTINHGFSSTVKTNPTLLSTYVEYQFLKKHIASLRFQAFDLFNQNTGITRTVSSNQIIDTRTNRLGRYFLLSFTLRLQQFAGGRKGGGFRNGGGGRGGGRRGSFE
ncbi:outer membrane beta-barrel family protein [Mucilaginibacter jinjuensis]|uniref:Outer membrane beta-barrel family protein n=1 Tax=Mucilaginibacter jinjuensis TaxID=1176721 RepID=A0ABY7T0U7_9SPHI|nr:outer membrane beta-barrel family protein [Mucilaginibacter jinjuensis]WCT10036.1 outer membrane beta-barrel family protein [Mucilaginibacter jinjuensis]